MFFVICPMAFGGAYSTLGPGKQLAFAALFHAGWFVESQWTQSMVIHTLRTRHIPIIQSNASKIVYLLTGCGIAVSTCLAVFIGFGAGPQKLGLLYFIYIVVVVLVYSFVASIAKNAFVKKYGELL